MTSTITYINQDAARLAGGWLETLADRLICEMRAEGITDPLGEPITMAYLLADLFRLAGAPLPRDIANRLD